MHDGQYYVNARETVFMFLLASIFLDFESVFLENIAYYHVSLLAATQSEENF